MKASWRLSIFLCTMVKFLLSAIDRLVNISLSLFTCIDVFVLVQVRALGLIGYVLTSSFLIRENILAVVSLFPFKTYHSFHPKNKQNSYCIVLADHNQHPRLTLLCFHRHGPEPNAFHEPHLYDIRNSGTQSNVFITLLPIYTGR